MPIPLSSHPPDAPEKSGKDHANQTQGPDRKYDASHSGDSGLLKRQTHDAEQNTCEKPAQENREQRQPVPKLARSPAKSAP